MDDMISDLAPIDLLIQRAVGFNAISGIVAVG